VKSNLHLEKSIRSIRSSSRGSVSVESVLIVTFFFFFVGGAIDWGLLLYTKNVAQHLARGGAREFATQTVGANFDPAALSYYQANKPGVMFVKNLNVTGNRTTNSTGLEQVSVRVQGTYSPFFLQAVGINNLVIDASGSSYYERQTPP